MTRTRKKRKHKSILSQIALEELSGDLEGIMDLSNDPQVAQAIAHNQANREASQSVNDKIEDTHVRHALVMLAGVTAAATALMGALHHLTSDPRDFDGYTLKRNIQAKLHAQGVTPYKMSVEDGKKIIETAKKEIEAMKREIHPKKMMAKGLAKWAAIFGACSMLILGVYHTYLKVAMKIHDSKAEEFNRVANHMDQIVQA